MSKSYHNTIPLFEGGEKALKEAVGRIVTDSRAPGEPKPDAEQSHLYILYQAFASEQAAAAFKADLLAGMGWGEAKKALLQLLESQIAPMRERYVSLMDRPDEIEDILQEGARKARRIATPFLAQIREAVGLSTEGRRETQEKPTKKPAKPARFVSFRETDGHFKFRFLSTEGKTLLTSVAFADAQTAGKMIAKIRASAQAEAHLVLAGSQLHWMEENQVVAATEAASEAQAQSLRQAVLDALQSLQDKA